MGQVWFFIVSIPDLYPLSYFDKHHYKDLHRPQYAESTRLALSIIFNVFHQIQRNFQWELKMQWATAFYANHLLDGAMDSRWLENAKYCFLQKSAKLLMVIFLSRTYHFSTNGFQTNIETSKMCSTNIFQVSDLFE